MGDITQDYLKQLLAYDPGTGVFVRKTTRASNAQLGDVAGWVNERRYRLIKIDNITHRVHRLAWLYVYGKFPTNEIDHINHDRSDNRIANLREATSHENSLNKELQARNTSGVNGVTWRKMEKKWCAQIGVNGETLHLGRFINFDDAVVARKAADKKYGYHENHGKALVA